MCRNRGFRHVFPIQDVAIDFVAGEPCIKFNHVESMRYIKFFVANDRIQCCYADGQRGVEKAVEHLGILFQKTEPGEPQTNSKAERFVEIYTLGLRMLLHHAGLPACFFPYAGPMFYTHRNNRISKKSQKIPYKERFGRKWEGEEFPFGCGVYFIPQETKKLGISKPSPPVIFGIVVGYTYAPGYMFGKQY